MRELLCTPLVDQWWLRRRSWSVITGRLAGVSGILWICREEEGSGILWFFFCSWELQWMTWEKERPFYIDMWWLMMSYTDSLLIIFSILKRQNNRVVRAQLYKFAFSCQWVLFCFVFLFYLNIVTQQHTSLSRNYTCCWLLDLFFFKKKKNSKLFFFSRRIRFSVLISSLNPESAFALKLETLLKKKRKLETDFKLFFPRRHHQLETQQNRPLICGIYEKSWSLLSCLYHGSHSEFILHSETHSTFEAFFLGTCYLIGQ